MMLPKDEDERAKTEDAIVSGIISKLGRGAKILTLTENMPK